MLLSCHWPKLCSPSFQVNQLRGEMRRMQKRLVFPKYQVGQKVHWGFFYKWVWENLVFLASFNESLVSVLSQTSAKAATETTSP